MATPMKDLLIKLLERLPHTRWWAKRIRRERLRWIHGLSRLS